MKGVETYMHNIYPSHVIIHLLVCFKSQRDKKRVSSTVHSPGTPNSQLGMRPWSPPGWQGPNLRSHPSGLPQSGHGSQQLHHHKHIGRMGAETRLQPRNSPKNIFVTVLILHLHNTTASSVKSSKAVDRRSWTKILGGIQELTNGCYISYRGAGVSQRGRQKQQWCKYRLRDFYIQY